MDENLYKHRGGYRTGNAALSVTGNNGTWPLACLTLNDLGVFFTYPGNQINLSYADIQYVDVLRSGYIRFTAKDASQSFAFTGIGLGKIVNALQSKQVFVADSEQAKVTLASLVVWFQIFFSIAFLALVVGLFAHSILHQS